MERGWDRPAAVAGKFYPGNPTSLRKTLQEFFSRREPDPSITAIVAPHAGYIYSGRFAAEAYRRLEPPKRVIVLSPNHTGHGKRISVWTRGNWITPLGEVRVDEESCESFLEKLQLGEGDREAHRFEHAAEVHVPFLQFLNPEVEIVPIVLATLSPEYCAQVGKALAELVQERPALIVASTDMSHYIPAVEAKALDELALSRIEEGDGVGLYQTVRRHQISMCGFIPTTCLLEALGRKARAVRLAYGHSGEVTGDSESVVAYASVKFTRSE